MALEFPYTENVVKLGFVNTVRVIVALFAVGLYPPIFVRILSM